MGSLRGAGGWRAEDLVSVGVLSVVYGRVSLGSEFLVGR